MARQRFDMGSKWLLTNQGKGALCVGGLKDVRRTESMPGELVQNRRYPDGLLQVYLHREPKPCHALIEIATYPEKRALKQALDDLTLAYSALGHLPELLMFVLRPKGRFRISGNHEIESKLGLSRIEVTWKVVELWKLSAEEFLNEGDVGIVPWIPLMRFDGSPEIILERCAEKIDKLAQPTERTDLLVISQVMASLRFGNLDLLNVFGGQNTMIESPLIQKVRADTTKDNILEILKGRFGAVPRDLTKNLRAISEEKKLRRLIQLATHCPELEAFSEALR